MIRRLVLVALLLVVAGCTTDGGGYYARDYGYYDGYGRDDAYYDEPYYDGYGAYPYDYDDYYSYSYGYGGSPWGLGRYSCGGWYSCSPSWGGGWGWSLSFGNGWYGSPWAYGYGSSWWPYYAYGWYSPYHYRRPRHPDPDERVVPHKPMVEENTAAYPSRRTAPGEYLRPSPSRGLPRQGVGVSRPITGPETPMAKPQPALRVPPRRAPVREAAPQPRYEQPRPQPRYEQPRPQPRYEQPRPQPRYEQPRPQPRYEQPRPPPREEAPRVERPAPERAPVRESRSPSQNRDRDSLR